MSVIDQKLKFQTKLFSESIKFLHSYWILLWPKGEVSSTYFFPTYFSPMLYDPGTGFMTQHSWCFKQIIVSFWTKIRITLVYDIFFHVQNGMNIFISLLSFNTLWLVSYKAEMYMLMKLLNGKVDEINLWCPTWDNILEFFTCQHFHLSVTVTEQSNLFCWYPNFCWFCKWDL